ncbi:hypothetical protein JTE90_027563 [Oedothorax gibbosus]|uniref:Uncharacterized protein n=1 Tax=Oedothorax gibbosus TaxID=931172 RepID=A0AAV6VL15_9ARAC|nr:hypothetical protein JTE90_027563 [Oedothorax gibbosus]
MQNLWKFASIQHYFADQKHYVSKLNNSYKTTLTSFLQTRVDSPPKEGFLADSHTPLATAFPPSDPGSAPSRPYCPGVYQKLQFFKRR